MKKALSILFLIGLLASGNIAYAQQEIDACKTFNKAKDYKRAIEAGELAVKKYPENLNVYLCLGETYYNVGELNLAYENAKKAESLTDNKEDLMYIYNLIGNILLRMGRLDDALLYSSKSLSLAKDLNNTDMQSAGLNIIANIYEKRKELDKALSYYEESLSLQVNEKVKAGIYNNIAIIYHYKGNYQNAIEYFQKAIEIEEKYGDYHGVSMKKLNLGFTFSKIKDYEKAEKYLSEGLEGVKKVGDKLWEATGYGYFGILYIIKGDKETAREYYNRAYNLFKSIGAEGNAQEVLNEIKKVSGNIAYAQQEIDACNTFNKAGDYKRAIEAGELAVKKYPENLNVYLCLGVTYYNVGELNLAYENAKKAESLTDNEKNLMYIYNLIGNILKRMGRLDDALLYFSRSLSLAKNLGDTDMQSTVLNNIATIYHERKELDKALSYYEESLSLQVNEKVKAGIYNNIAGIYSKKGDYQKVVQYYQKAIEIAEKYGDYHRVSMVKLNLGNTYRKMKDYENAEKYLSEGLEGVKKVGDKLWEATGNVYFGRLYKDKGDKKTAREYYNRAYNLFKSIGAEGNAQEVLNDIKKLDESN